MQSIRARRCMRGPTSTRHRISSSSRTASTRSSLMHCSASSSPPPPNPGTTSGWGSSWPLAQTSIPRRWTGSSRRDCSTSHRRCWQRSGYHRATAWTVASSHWPNRSTARPIQSSMPERSAPERATQSTSTSQTLVTSKTSERRYRLRITSTVSDRQWNELVADATQATPFHRYEFLETLADHTGTTFHSFVGFADDRPLGLFPVFEKSVGPLTALFSPAPNLKIRYLGPVVFDWDGADTVGHERRRQDFVGAALSCFEDRFDPSYVLVRTAGRFGDHRPFLWAGFEATPQYSYVVDLTPDASSLLDQFSSGARRKIRTETPELHVSEEDPDAIASILDRLRARH